MTQTSHNHEHPSHAFAVVSDLGTGGQVFTDSPTFEAIKQRLSELGAVNQNGLDAGGADGRSGWFSWLRCVC